MFRGKGTGSTAIAGPTSQPGFPGGGTEFGAPPSPTGTFEGGGGTDPGSLDLAQPTEPPDSRTIEPEGTVQPLPPTGGAAPGQMIIDGETGEGVVERGGAVSVEQLRQIRQSQQQFAALTGRTETVEQRAGEVEGVLERDVERETSLAGVREAAKSRIQRGELFEKGLEETREARLQQAQQFAESLGVNKEQFAANLAFNEKQLAQQLGLAEKTLSLRERRLVQELALAREGIRMQLRQAQSQGASSLFALLGFGIGTATGIPGAGAVGGVAGGILGPLIGGGK